MEFSKSFERDLIKKYRSKIWSKFVKAVKEYKLVEEGDKVLVAISGGKDSLVLAKLLQELSIHGDYPFELEFACMDPGFNKANVDLIIENCNKLDIPVKIYKSDIFSVADKIAEKNPCFMCARMRRGFLYTKARELGCNKLALGHHYDDVIQTTLLNLIYAGSVKTMMPKLKSKNFPEIDLIRPLYLVREKSIINVMNSYNIVCEFLGCELASKKQTSNKRQKVKSIIDDLNKEYELADKNIFTAMTNINLSQVLGYKTEDNEEIDFNEIYERTNKNE